MNFKSLSDLLSGGVTPIEQVDITGNMNVEEKLNEIIKSMSFGGMIFKRIRTINLSTADPHLGQKVWFMIGFQHTAASDSSLGYGVQIFFPYTADQILIRRIVQDQIRWVKYEGTLME